MSFLSSITEPFHRKVSPLKLHVQLHRRPCQIQNQGRIGCIVGLIKAQGLNIHLQLTSAKADFAGEYPGARPSFPEARRASEHTSLAGSSLKDGKEQS